MMFRLHSRLVFWNLVIIGLMVGILGYFLASSVREHIVGEIEERLTQETALAGLYFAQAGQTTSPDENADKLGNLLKVRVTLIGHDGRVLGDSDLNGAELQSVENHRSRPEVQAAEQSGTGVAVRWSPTVRTDFIYVARRFDPYVVRLALPLAAVDSLMADVRSRLAVAALLAIGLTTVFGYIVRGLISTPLREMAAASRRLAAGDLGQRLPISGDEEIAALGNSLNTMAKNLSTKLLEVSEGKQRLELIVGAMTEGVMVLDNTGRISLTNQALSGLLGTDRDLIGRTPLEVFRSPGVENAVRSVLDGGLFEVVETVVGSGSATRTLQANVAPVANAAGVVDSVVVVFHDLTNIRLTEKMRRDFVANVSHEFKTPLTSIRGYAETLQAGVQDPETAADFLRIIERNAQHLETLVTDLLMLARLEADVPVSKEPVNVKVLVEEQISTRKSTIAERGLRVSNECEPIEIDADRLRLSTAISNLIDNAIYYNRQDGEIRISGALVNGNFNLSIADSGQGIPADALPRIFERFYRVDKARSRESGRTGLGLAIVKHAVESQGGSISVTSRLGTGSTFSIKLPV